MTAVLNQWSERPEGPGGHSSRAINDKPSSATPGPPGPLNILREPLMSKVILVTGAGRGLGTDIVREALAAGHQVVATGRRPGEVEKSLGGPQDNLLVTKLDVTSLEDAEAAAQAAVDRFGRIDVLVNNAGNFFAGYFEEITPAQ